MKHLPTFIVAIVVCVLVNIPATLEAASADNLYFDDLNLGKPNQDKDGSSGCSAYRSKTWGGNKTVKHFYIYYTDSTVICISYWETQQDGLNPKKMIERYFSKSKAKLINFGDVKEFETSYLNLGYVGFTLSETNFSMNCFAFTTIKHVGDIDSYIQGMYCGRDDSERAFKADLGKLRFKIQPPVHSNVTKSGDDDANEPDRSTPTTSQSSDDIETRLRKLKQLEAEGLISKEDYARKRQELLDKL